MAREGLRARLRGAIGKCLETKRPVSVTARVRRGEKSVPVKATVSPLRHPREADGLLLVTFEDHRLAGPEARRKTARESDVQQLEDELKVTREELQSTIEQLEKLQRAAQGLQRRGHGRQRGAAVRQRGAGDLEGGAAVPQRGAQHRQRPPPGEGGRAGSTPTTTWSTCCPAPHIATVFLDKDSGSSASRRPSRSS